MVLTGIDVLWVADGLIVERWSEYDMLCVFEGLGLYTNKTRSSQESPS
jgi:hypothetical protein